MNRRKAIIASLAGLTVVGGLAAVVAWKESWWGGPGRRHGWWGHPRRGGLARLCTEGAGERLEHALAEARSRLAIRADQEAPWQSFATALRGAADRVAQTCHGVGFGAPDTPAPERLAQAETILDSGLGALRGVRPSFDALYQALDADQRRRVDRLFERRHRA